MNQETNASGGKAFVDTEARPEVVENLARLVVSHARPSHGFPFELNSVADVVSHVATSTETPVSESEIAVVCQVLVPGYEGLTLYRQHADMWRVCRNCMMARGSHSWSERLLEMVCVEPNEEIRRNRAIARDRRTD